MLSRATRGTLDGAVLADHAFVLRWFADKSEPRAADHDRLLVVNLRDRVHAEPAAEPLLGLDADVRWSVLFSTEDTKYGGWGTPPLDSEKNGWWIPAESAVLLMPTPVPNGD